MTDNEIIKALGYCLDAVDEGDTRTFDFLSAVIDLINRQRAEIKRLNSKLAAKDSVNYYNIAQLRIAREKLKNLEQENSLLSRDADTAFQDGLNEAQDLYAEQVRQEIKSEAIKEFAERLKEKKYGDFDIPDYVLVADIDNLVKQMTEVKENEQDV